MSENKIKVSASTTSKAVRVNVSTPTLQGTVALSQDTSAYNAKMAEQWAISENIVLGKDYSSKYYANKAKENATTVKNYESSTRETYNSFLNASANAVQEVHTTRDEAITNIENSKIEAVDSINSTKTTIINDIEFVADGEKKEIEDLIDNGKDELRESIGDVKILTTLEIGDIGIAPIGIDETKGKRRYLNGQLIIQEQYVQFANKVKSAIALYPSLACTESEWQTTTTMSVGGQVGKFVVDDEAGTIRLPKIIMPIQGLTDLSKLAEIVEAGLPNITGYTSWQVNGIYSGSFGQANANNTNNGALYVSGSGKYGAVGVSGSDSTTSGTQVNINASRSNPIYGKSNTVQQEQIQYPYFIQVATGAETEDNIINEIELNNPFSLLDYKYSEYELNNISWLRSNGQWNSKAVYPAVYDLLLKERNGVSNRLPKTINANVIGSLQINDGVMSGFSSANYATVPTIPTNIASYEIVSKFTTGAVATGTQQGVIANSITNKATPQIVLEVSNARAVFQQPLDASTWSKVIAFDVVANKTYWTKAVWDGSTVSFYYKESQQADWTLVGSQTATTIYWTEVLGIGIDGVNNPFQGSIDLNESYININGKRWWNGCTSVKLSTEDYTDYDFVLNTAEETFRLPIKVKLASGKAVVGNGYAMIWNDTVRNYGMKFNTSGDTNRASYFTTDVPVAVGTETSTAGAGTYNLAMGLSQDSSMSGVETSDSDLYLYFYVGETVQNANLINAGRIQEKVAEAITRMDCKAYVTETYKNGTSWYRVYSDGWCEQGGIFNEKKASEHSINLLKSFSNTSYSVLFSYQASDGDISNGAITTRTKTTTSFNIYTWSADEICWRACGYIA